MKNEQEINMNDWHLMETTPTVTVNTLETTAEFQRLVTVASANKRAMRVSGYLNGVVDGVIGGSMLTGTLSWVVIPLATSATVTLPPIAFFALATSGIIATYNIISTSSSLTEKEFKQKTLIEHLEARCTALEEGADLEHSVYIKNALQQTNAELVVKIIQLARQLNSVDQSIDLDLLDEILETLAKATQYTGDETRYPKFLPHILNYLNDCNPEKRTMNAFIIERFYQEFSGRSTLPNYPTRNIESNINGYISGFFQRVKRAAPKLQTAQANTMLVTRNPAIAAPFLVSVGVDHILGEQAIKHEASLESAQKELEDKIDLINLMTRMIQEKSKSMTQKNHEIEAEDTLPKLLRRTSSMPEIHTAAKRLGFISSLNPASELKTDSTQDNEHRSDEGHNTDIIKNVKGV